MLGRKENREESVNLRLALHSRPNRNPVELQNLPGEELREARSSEILPGVIVVPGEMPAFLFCDAIAQSLEHRIRRALPEPLVTPKSGHLLDSPKRHVDRRELAGEQS